MKDNTIKTAGIIYNDVVNGQGVCVSVWTQGCPHHCPKCHNPETWSFTGGTEQDKSQLIFEIVTALNRNGIQRNLSILGGEPLCDENIPFVAELIGFTLLRAKKTKIYIWSGYTFEELFEKSKQNTTLKNILTHTDWLIDGPYINELRDITLPLRGSSNQRILDCKVSMRRQEAVEIQ